MSHLFNLYKQTVNTLRNMSIFKRIILVYLVAVIIPIITIGIYTYQTSKAFINNEILHNTSKTISQIKNDINFKILITQNICMKVAYNYKIQMFLSTNFNPSANSVIYYLNDMSPYIEYAKELNQINIYDLSIYSKNTTIPERWDYYYHDIRLKNVDWYQQFLSDSKDSCWLPSINISTLKPNEVKDNNSVFTYVQKIKTLSGKYSGIVTLSILNKDMLSSISNLVNNGEVIYILDENAKPVFSPEKNGGTVNIYPFLKYKNSAANDSNGFTVIGSNIYVYEKLDSLKVTILYVVSTNKMSEKFNSVITKLIFIALVSLAVIAMFNYLSLKSAYLRFKKILSVMKCVSKGNFLIRIPVDRKDEIAQISEDFNLLIQKIDIMIKDMLKKETAHKNARIQALQHQINPHFIYNTLDVFRMKMELDGNFGTADAIAEFSGILRYNINSESFYASIKQEVEHVNNYVNLQRFRYGAEKVGLDIKLDVDIMQLSILKFILQPVVENCFTHGYHTDLEAFLIKIEFELLGNELQITITDNGSGIDSERLTEINSNLKCPEAPHLLKTEGTNIGLVNINDRIKLFYGEQYFIQLESVKGIYTRTIIKIPCKKD